MYFYLFPGGLGGGGANLAERDFKQDAELNNIREDFNADETLDDIRADLNSGEDLGNSDENNQELEEPQKSLLELEQEASDLLSSLPNGVGKAKTEEEFDVSLLGRDPSEKDKSRLDEQKLRWEVVAGKSWDFIVRSARASDFKTALDNIFGSSYDSSGGRGGLSSETSGNSENKEGNLEVLKNKLVKGGNSGVIDAIYFAYDHAKINKNDSDFKEAETDGGKFNQIKKDFLAKVELDKHWERIQEGLSYYSSGNGDTSWKFDKRYVKGLFENEAEFKKSEEKPKEDPKVGKTTS